MGRVERPACWTTSDIDTVTFLLFNGFAPQSIKPIKDTKRLIFEFTDSVGLQGAIAAYHANERGTKTLLTLRGRVFRESRLISLSGKAWGVTK